MKTIRILFVCLCLATVALVCLNIVLAGTTRRRVVSAVWSASTIVYHGSGSRAPQCIPLTQYVKENVCSAIEQSEFSYWGRKSVDYGFLSILGDDSCEVMRIGVLGQNCVTVDMHQLRLQRDIREILGITNELLR